jgi:DNA-binding beta-propeller fold protein YncE
VIEFDPEGNVVNAWGYDAGYEGPGFTWPASNHGITVDHMNNIWIGGNGGSDSMVLKFTHDGQFLAQYGGVIPGVDSNATDRFAGVADIAIDGAASEAYIADGYRNVRVAVVDIETGAMKRFWGAYGNVPDDDYEFTDVRQGGTGWSADAMPQQQYRGPVHCAEPTNDGRVYVCDRQNNRVQEFTKEGEYLREAFYNPDTLGDGATWDISFSPDPEQRFMYVVDGKNARVHIVNRETMEAVSSIGSGGRYPGQFQAAHSIIADSQGNLYVTETYEGRRVHKFVYQGIQQVPRHQGAAWPASAP